MTPDPVPGSAASLAPKAISWRDTFSTWPSIRIQVELLPWHWRVWWWSDRPETWSGDLTVGPLSIQWWTNRCLFPIERPAVAACFCSQPDDGERVHRAHACEPWRQAGEQRG